MSQTTIDFTHPTPLMVTTSEEGYSVDLRIVLLTTAGSVDRATNQGISTTTKKKHHGLEASLEIPTVGEDFAVDMTVCPRRGIESTRKVLKITRNSQGVLLDYLGVLTLLVCKAPLLPQQSETTCFGVRPRAFMQLLPCE